jgi:pyrroloquinoline quinone biosynthesis protein B
VAAGFIPPAVENVAAGLAPALGADQDNLTHMRRTVLLLALAALSCTTAAPSPPPPATGPRLLVLGTAQDGGIPHAACDGPRCTAARRNPALRRRVASLGIVTGGSAYLVDATPDFVDQLHALRRAVGEAPVGGTDRTPLAGIFLTHAHMGHYVGLVHLGFEAVHAEDVELWATPRMVGFLSSNGPWDQLVELENVLPRPTGDGEAVELPGGVTVTPIAVPHRDEYSDTVGYVIAGPGHRVLYVPDTDGWEAWAPSLGAVLDRHRIDVALLDATFYSLDELPGRTRVRHPLVVDSMELLQERVDEGRLRVLFIHLNHSNPAVDPTSEEAKTIRDRGFEVASEGQEIPL